MASMTGVLLRVSIFGQSHSGGIGVVLDGLPAGLHVDEERLQAFLDRRAPGRNAQSTQRKEADRPRFLSGLVNGYTCGAPISAVIENADTRSKDYEALRDCPRPSHADYAAFVKYGRYHDIRGGGHFSGRLTAPLCIAGGICLQLLEQRNIRIAAHVRRIAAEEDRPFDPLGEQEETLAALGGLELPALDLAAGERMRQAILQARSQGDSLGGVVEAICQGVPAGLGQPMFGGVENRLAQLLFAIPAVKAVEFGEGLGFASLRGSQANDPFAMAQDGSVRTKTNRCGGILGGISSGMPILCRCAFKPTPSIAQEQQSVSLKKGCDQPLVIHGRHDPCIVPRAVPCVEAALAIGLTDLLLERAAEKGL